MLTKEEIEELTQLNELLDEGMITEEGMRRRMQLTDKMTAGVF